ncbi:MAG: asparaginase domain-containing protein [Clostridium sp.]|nr:MAG: asparaginase domain-containing protein [Clostridium sp.]
MKNILLITTGGTISSIVSKEGLVPSNSQEILKEFGLHNLDINLSVLDLMCKDSTNISPKDWVIIAKAIYNNLKKYDGIVVTHGTDTMAYTTSMLSYMLQNPSIPVVFTGSQLPISHPLTDGINNLHYAFAMASSGIPGIYMAFDRKIILGCRAVKVRTTGFHAFESINMKSVGTIDSKRIRYF